MQKENAENTVKGNTGDVSNTSVPWTVNPPPPKTPLPNKTSKSDEFSFVKGGAVMKLAAMPFWIGGRCQVLI